VNARAATVGRIALVALAIATAIVLVLPDVIRAVWIAAYGVAGGILVVRRPRNSIGWLLALLALSFTGITDLTGAQVAAMRRGDADAVETARIWVGAMSGAWAFLAYAVLGLVFPSGRLPDGRWRRPTLWVLAFAALALAVAMVHPGMSVTMNGGATTLTVPNPYAVMPASDIWAVLPDGDLAFLLALVLLLLSVPSVVVRARRSTGIVRLQMRWLAAALAFLLVSIGVGAVLSLIGSSVGRLAWLPAPIAFATVPLAILVAVLRYHLLDIDRLISRTIGWGLATGILAAVFLGAVGALQALLVDVTQGETVAVAASTLLTAAVFQRVRRRLQVAVDRRFDRAHADRDRVLAAVGARLRDEVDLVTIQGEILASASDVLRPTATAIWLRPRVTS
jgi:hypothetical protein